MVLRPLHSVVLLLAFGTAAVVGVGQQQQQRGGGGGGGDAVSSVTTNATTAGHTALRWLAGLVSSTRVVGEAVSLTFGVDSSLRSISHRTQRTHETVRTALQHVSHGAKPGHVGGVSRVDTPLSQFDSQFPESSGTALDEDIRQGVEQFHRWMTGTTTPITDGSTRQARAARKAARRAAQSARGLAWVDQADPKLVGDLARIHRLAATLDVRTDCSHAMMRKGPPPFHDGADVAGARTRYTACLLAIRNGAQGEGSLAKNRGRRTAPPSHLLPEYLPEYLRHFGRTSEEGAPSAAVPPAEAAGHHAHAQQATTSTATVDSPYCEDGIQVYKATTNFTCNVSTTPTNFTAAEVATQPSDVRATCTPYGAPADVQQCLCPRDALAIEDLRGRTYCVWRSVQCGTSRISPPLCESTPANDPFGVSQCVTVPRSSTLALSVNVSCRYAYADPKDFAFYGATVVPEPSSARGTDIDGDGTADEPPEFLAIDTFARTVTEAQFVKDLRNASSAPFGTYEELSDAVFTYAVEPASSVMPLTIVHPAVRDGYFFARPVNFNVLSDRAYQQVELLRTTAYTTGQLVGSVPVIFSFTLGNIPDSYLAANRLFIESGVRGPLVPERVNAQSFTIDFTDVPTPPIRTRGTSLTTIIIVVVLSLAVVAAAIVAMLVVYHKRKARKLARLKQDKDE